MAALTAERSIVHLGPKSTGVPIRTSLLVKTGMTIYKGSLVATDATGYAIAGAGISATGLKIWGIATKTVVNSGASGSVSVDVEQGDYLFTNLGGDPVAQADIGAGIFCEDDQTVRKTSNTSTRSAVGTFRGFDPSGSGLVVVRVGNFSQTGV